VTVAASFSTTLVDEWVRAGLTDAVVAPGSRSTPLALALAREERMALDVRVDERSAAFFAVGIGLGTGRPAVLVTTSGTAAAEVYAAVVEAHLSRVPLIVCTADRLPELHHVGAAQTIEQAGLFAGAVRWAVDPGVPSDETRSSWRSLASRLVAEATAGPAGPGPVHANLAFREPPLAEPGDLPPGRSNGRPWHRVEPVMRILDPGALDNLAGLARPSAKGLIMAGAGAGKPEAVRRLAGSLGWPVLADPRSGARVPGEEGSPTVAAADACLRVESFAASHVPEVVLHLGQRWASRVVGDWLDSASAAGAVQVHVDPHWAWRDPGRKADLVLPADPDHVIDALCSRETAGGGSAGFPVRAPSVWSEGWAEAEAVAQHAIERVLGRHAEVGVARALFAWLPAGSTVVASSSMPVRDLEWFAAPRSDPPRVLANRGANGIDGVMSTTLGVTAAAGGTGGPVVGFLGDLAFLNDSPALVRGRREPVSPAVLVVVDNGGGGIF
jgi:2-succinyl-5-enolpyruvyl-6-hydroxy-3-cyclohexene-1-carboxylate synthase